MVNVTVQWFITYIDINNGDVEKPFTYFSALEVNETLNSDILASFEVPNTNAMRNFLQTNYPMQIWIIINGGTPTQMFSGILKAGDISANKIKFYLYDPVIVALDEAEPITGVYDAVPADVIMADVIADTTVALGDCPTTDVTVVLYKANRLDIVRFLADALGLDYYPSSGTTINIAYRTSGVTRSIPAGALIISKRAIDRTKYAAKVIMRGIDLFGHHVTGEAGSGLPVRTFNCDTPANQDALENLAAKKLAEMQTDSAGAPISTRIDVGYEFQVGDSINVWSNRYMLSGQRRIMQITKTAKKVNMQLDYIRKTVDKTIADLRGWEAKGIYLPGCTSWSINLQWLKAFYHLTEGTGSAAADSAPVDNPYSGTIVNGHWDPSPIGGGAKVMALQADGYVDCGNGFSTKTNDDCFSITGWFSPAELNATARFLVHKDGEFALGIR